MKSRASAPKHNKGPVKFLGTLFQLVTQRLRILPTYDVAISTKLTVATPGGKREPVTWPNLTAKWF